MLSKAFPDKLHSALDAFESRFTAALKDDDDMTAKALLEHAAKDQELNTAQFDRKRKAKKSEGDEHGECGFYIGNDLCSSGVPT